MERSDDSSEEGTRDFGRRVARHYASEAGAYRDLWAPFLVRLARWLIEELPLPGARQVVDLGCGVGALLPRLREVAPDAVIIGLDRSEGMLTLAPRDFPLLAGDALRLPFRDGSIDAVTMVFMLFHLPQPAAALAEARRVLRPGGSIGLLTWGNERDSRAFTEWIEALDTEGAAEFDTKLAWHELVNSPRKMRNLLRSAGFGDVISRVKVFVEQPTCEEFVARRTSLGWGRYRLESLDERKRQVLLGGMRRRLEEMAPEDFEEESEVIITVARRTE